MNRVERHIIINNKELDRICFLSKNLYNYANYQIRQSFIQNKVIPKEYDLTIELGKENQVDYRALPIQTSQQVIKLLYKNWKSFFKAIKEYGKHPDKFLGRPKLPKYKEKCGKNIVIFTNQQINIKDDIIKFPKDCLGDFTIKTKVTNENLVQVRIVPQANCYVVEVVYKKEKQKCDINSENILSIDLGINNLATCVNNVGQRPFIINGRVLKSINQYSNKLRAKYMSYIGDKGTSNNLKRIILKRNNKVSNYMHHTSRFIIDYCKENKIGTIVIGHNDEWKQKANLGKRNNQNFINIPFNTLIQQISYKAEEYGIRVIMTNESYTSKIDHLANEEMKHQERYLGKRVKRGLFQSSIGKLINADVNGAIGIMKKVVKDFSIEIERILDRGLAFNPIVINL